MVKFAFVIENDKRQYIARPMWEAFWTHESEKAIRFSRKEDGEAVVDLLLKEAGEQSYSVVEHGWMDGWKRC